MAPALPAVPFVQVPPDAKLTPGQLSDKECVYCAAPEDPEHPLQYAGWVRVLAAPGSTRMLSCAVSACGNCRPDPPCSAS